MASSIAVTGIFCGSIIAASAVFFILEFRRLRLVRRRPRSFVSRSQSIRRLVGATGVVIIALMFFWGANFLSPRSPLTFAVFWAGVALGALVLACLGIIDMREVRRHFRDSRRNIFNINIPELPRRGIPSDEKQGPK